LKLLDRLATIGGGGDVAGHLHHPHGDHCDDHGLLASA